jgi:hypothetical protein
LDEATTYTFFGWAVSTAGRQLGRCQRNHRTEYPTADISLNDVSFTSMTVHMETVYAADKNVTAFDVSWIPHDGAMDSSDASNVYITGLDEATTYTFFGWTVNTAGKSELGRCQCDHRTARFSDISLNDVSFLTVHMETVYAEDKNVTGFDVSWIPTRRCHG